MINICLVILVGPSIIIYRSTSANNIKSQKRNKKNCYTTLLGARLFFLDYKGPRNSSAVFPIYVCRSTTDALSNVVISVDSNVALGVDIIRVSRIEIPPVCASTRKLAFGLPSWKGHTRQPKYPCIFLARDTAIIVLHHCALFYL